MKLIDRTENTAVLKDYDYKIGHAGDALVLIDFLLQEEVPALVCEDEQHFFIKPLENLRDAIARGII